VKNPERFTIGLMLATLVWCGIVIYQHPSPAECGCGFDDSSIVQDYDDEPSETSAGRRIRKVWFAGGAPAGLHQDEFQRRVMAALNEVSQFTATDFHQTQTKSEARIQIFVYSDAQMWQKRPDFKRQGLIPLELAAGNWIAFTVRPRFSGERILEATTIHGLGHTLGLQHVQTSGSDSIMGWDLPVTHPNATDKANFQARLGKQKL